MIGPVPAQRGNTPTAAGPAPGDDAVERYLEPAVSGDGRAGVRLALDLIDSGVPAGDVIVNLLGRAQREVGERWLANRWTVAEEHLVSGVTQKALDAIAFLGGSAPTDHVASFLSRRRPNALVVSCNLALFFGG